MIEMRILFLRVSHTKTSLVGTSISIPITGGRLNLGTWQGNGKCMLEMLESLTFDLTGIYLTEFRHLPHSRKVVATILCVSSFWPVASAKLLCFTSS